MSIGHPVSKIALAVAKGFTRETGWIPGFVRGNHRKLDD